MYVGLFRARNFVLAHVFPKLEFFFNFFILKNLTTIFERFIQVLFSVTPAPGLNPWYATTDYFVGLRPGTINLK